jgi:hypothetical protein
MILHNDSKLRLAADIDTLICAEIPDQHQNPELFETVKSAMIHGPCGALNKNSVCMADGKCTKDYPKELRENTILAQNGYPYYRRSDNGRTITVGPHEVNNQWIVPYNPYLTKKYNAHINVEACTSIKSVKYLFKYIYKGHDCANVQVTTTNELTHDEITTFLDTRYVSAPEGIWRLSEYKLHDHSHSVIRLPVHLPKQQAVYFQAGQHEAATRRAAEQDTMLTAFFNYNQEHPTQYCYNEFPIYFVFNKATKKWQPRKQRGHNIIARIYSVSPKDIERYCLRLLLLHIPGPKSFDDLRTIPIGTYETYKKACLHYNLLADDTEWDRALHEASAFQMPVQLRCLFATICLYCEPTEPMQLWITHKDAMIEDYLHHHETVQSAEQKALHDIQAILQQNGMSCLDFGLPNGEIIEVMDTDFDVDQQLNIAATNIALLNPEQRVLVDEVLEALEEIKQGHAPKCRAYFLDGPGGTGKTMVYNTLLACCRSQNIKVSPSAWTGIAAILLTGGRTCHSLFKLPVPILDTSVCHVSPTSVHAAFLRSVSMFIIDEASMVPVHALSAIDTLLRDITSIDCPFAGKIFLMGGDFRQVLPIVPRRPRTVIVENCIKSSPLWLHFKVHKLTKNMRAAVNQQQFAKWLLDLGDGALRCEHTVPDSISIPNQCNIAHGHIEDDVFPDMSNPKALTTTVILTPTNDTSLEVNNNVLKKLPGQQRVYLSTDAAICDDEEEANNYPVEFLNSITPSGMPPHKLILKTGAIVMLLRNLDIQKGLCNGTRMIIHRLHDRVLDAEVITGTNKGDRVLIPRIKLAPSDAALPFTLQRIQFPIRLSYSMTINKSQGQTFDKLGIYLPSPVFAHGQLYVAFSRARSFQDIYVKLGQTATHGALQCCNHHTECCI